MLRNDTPNNWLCTGPNYSVLRENVFEFFPNATSCEGGGLIIMILQKSLHRRGGGLVVSMGTKPVRA